MERLILQAVEVIASMLTEIEDHHLRRVVALRLLRETCK